ncbi:alfa-L-rhamnosidase [Paenibacillus baekrokdamisoli]|uniref:alpha-L-rhamnosidase n=1 Tax=Paenibacillus baekrokdamisoli TaxID=1712516 RepID=A0A3G9IWR4_9BACL|nr:alpha-L-rhamnosidase [Paenibacillus baekrokdamisoli]MBB3068225.1 alpha-L-rhamnosidase [Paenibacillus baekrokdamisoli]BBH22732.1 alfa-L-rhamnosidase [Paenibacillus baekrokdamisoli]
MTNQPLHVHSLQFNYKTNPIGISPELPRVSWKLGAGPNSRDVVQTAYQIQVTANDEGFEQLLADSGKVNSDQSVLVKVPAFKADSRTRYYYRVKAWDGSELESQWSEPAFFETGLLQESDWEAAWITNGTSPGGEGWNPSPLFRQTAKLGAQIKSARIYATAHGVYELYLNGTRVGSDVLAPGWTDYKTRLQVQTYDVTNLLLAGADNAIGIHVGSGWYAGRIGWMDDYRLNRDRAALLQLHVNYEDGSEEVIKTDSTWRTIDGPVRLSEIYDGEHYDARLEKKDWSVADYDDAEWNAVETCTHSKAILVAQENLPTRIVRELKPIEVILTPAGETVIDMGQNMVGWVRFNVTGQAGQMVSLLHAEVLDAEGNFYTDNLRSAKQRVEYVLKGEGKETYEPYFSFQGFRFIKLDSYPGEVDLENFTGCVVHTDMELTGTFSCSDDRLNQLQHNIEWGQRGNFLDVPTDCPQRDERLGWTGDAQAFARTAAFNMNVASFFQKWLRDVKSEQNEEGGIPFVIPNVLKPTDHSSSAWGDAAVICPWVNYISYGDDRFLIEQYESMRAWVEYIRKQGDNELLWNTGFHFGDWLGLDAHEGSYVGSTPQDLIATAFYAYSTGLVAKAAEALGNEGEAAKYKELHSRIVGEFQREFITPSGRLIGSTQTGYVLTLMFDLAKLEDREKVAKQLVKDLEKRGIHLSTGFVGTPYLCLVLSRFGYHDVAGKLVQQEDYPSWLYAVKKGATTIWEHWDGIKEDGSFWSADMNSFNHYAYGAVGEWLYRIAGGVDTSEDRPGYKHAILAPKPWDGISFARTTHQSQYGEVALEWHRDDAAGTMKVELTIPTNTTASVELPYAQLSDVQESGAPLVGSSLADVSSQAGSEVRLELGSGNYRFEYAITR